jgi:hypothetical protein
VEERLLRTVLQDPCARCGRTLLDLRRDASRDALRGSALLCPVPACPLVQKVMGFPEAPRVAGRELHGPSPPAVFVGRHGYPNVTMGPLLPATPESAPHMGDSPAEWARDLDIADVLAIRARLFRSKAPVRVDARDASRALEVSRDLAMAAKPVETEVTLAKPPRFSLEPRVDLTATPMGPSVDVVDARVLSHPSIPRRVDAAVSDVHADAATGVGELYGSGVSPYHIQRLLSVGLLGEGRRRKLVPTRWSITATDDILGKQAIERVKAHPALDAPQVFASSLFGNHFQVLLLPRAWAFEMLEARKEGETWGFGHDMEGYGGRTQYVQEVAGAYYAARLSVLEHLERVRRQAAVFVYREITEEYWAPLGVWVIREGVKAAVDGKGLTFGDVESAVRHVTRRARTPEWVRHAVLPREARVQRTLKDFLGQAGPAGAEDGQAASRDLPP